MKRLLLAVLGIAAALAALEIGVRLVSARAGGSIEAIIGRRAPPPGAELHLGDMIRPAANELVVYELRPNLRGRFLGRDVAINALGMRMGERPLAKPEGTFRIVGIGDSVMFGWGVDEAETYLSRLEHDLGTRFPDRRFEAWNLAVPGYNAVQEVAALGDKIDALDPDLLVVGWVGNDMDLPNFLTAPSPVWSLDRSFLLDMIFQRWSSSEQTTAAGLFEVPVDETTRRHALAPDSLPARYRPLVGLDNMNAAYRRLLSIAEERRIPAVVVFIGGPRWFVERCAKQGFIVVEAQHEILRYEAEHHVDRHVALQLSPSDPHPNAIGHALIEQALVARLVTADALRPRRAETERTGD